MKRYPDRKWTYVGIDDGAIYGLSHLCRQEEFKKIVLINMPITHELGNTIELLNGFDCNKIKFIYGDKDASYKYTPLLKRLYIDVFSVKGADHAFTGMIDSFVNLQIFV